LRKRGGVLFLLMFLFWLFSTFAVASDNVKDVKQPITTQKLVDLAVVEIYAFSCACDLPGIDALYFNKISVELTAQIKFPVDDSSVIGILKVSYFDLLSGRTENREVMLQANLFRGRASALVDVVTTPLLVKKSVGITAEVKVAGAATGDPNLANNKKKVNVCKVRII